MFLVCQFCYNVVFKITIDASVAMTTLQFIERIVFCLLITAIVLIARLDLRITPQQRWPLLARSLIGVSSSFLYLGSIKLLPIGIAMVTQFTVPFWSTLTSYFILGEMIKLREILCMFVAFGGVIIIGTAFSTD